VAVDAFSGFLECSPGSVRAGEASAMLGCQFVESGDLDAAKVRSECVVIGCDFFAQKSGREGLTEILRRLLPVPPQE